MTVHMAEAPIAKRSEHLYRVLSGERFLKMQGLGNEVPFFICPFNPGDAIEMEQVRHQLVNRLKQNGVTVLEINLYDLSIELLQERGRWERILEIEPKTPKEELKELLQGMLDPETYLVPAIAKKMTAHHFDILFLSGVGEVFPYIRSHNVLNNLQSTAKEKPTVMFFPGAYTQSLETGASLTLFKTMQDDKYYRAFNIYHCEV